MQKLAVLSLFLFLTACGSQPSTKVAANQYGDKWPLNVDSGILTCESPKHIVLTTKDGKKYGVNGSASNDYPSILEITKDQENLGVTFKMPVDFLIEEGLKLCK